MLTQPFYPCSLTADYSQPTIKISAPCTCYLVPEPAWEDARVWTHWNHSFDMHFSYLGPVFCVFTSWVPSELTMESGCRLRASRWWVFFSFLRSLRVHQLTILVTAIAGNWHLLFTDLAGNIPFLTGFCCKTLLYPGSFLTSGAVPQTQETAFWAWVFRKIHQIKQTLTCKLCFFFQLT